MSLLHTAYTTKGNFTILLIISQETLKVKYTCNEAFPQKSIESQYFKLWFLSHFLNENFWNKFADYNYVHKCSL